MAYVDGANLYRAYFATSKFDPLGLSIKKCKCNGVWNEWTTFTSGDCQDACCPEPPYWRCTGVDTDPTKDEQDVFDLCSEADVKCHECIADLMDKVKSTRTSSGILNVTGRIVVAFLAEL